MAEAIPIKCPGCGTLFGNEDPVRGVLNIKFRDLFREVEGRCTGPCRRCGTVVEWRGSSNERRR